MKESEREGEDIYSALNIRLRDFFLSQVLHHLATPFKGLAPE